MKIDSELHCKFNAMPLKLPEMFHLFCSIERQVILYIILNMESHKPIRIATIILKKNKMKGITPSILSPTVAILIKTACY